MRRFVGSSLIFVVVFGFVSPAFAEKLSPEQRIELVRALTAEFATVKVLLPRSKKPLPLAVNGTMDKAAWDEAQRSGPPAARAGDLVQVTAVEIGKEKLTFEINGGAKSKRKWYHNIEVGAGGSGRTTPINPGQNVATLGTSLALDFGTDGVSSDAVEIKKLLAPVLDFEKRTATEQLIDTFPPEIQEAIKEQRASEGMNREQVLMAVGKPRTKVRESKEGLDTEDWIYGVPPGKVTFITFADGKVTRVKDTYAGLGGQTMAPLPVK